MAANIVLWSCLIVPWLSLFFLDGKVIRRYVPAALFVTVINTILSQLAWTYHWWTIDKPLFTWSKVIDFPVVYCAILVGTIWIFTYTFRRFWLYALVKVIVDAVFVYDLGVFIENMRLMSLGTMSKLQLYLLMLGVSVLVYLFQMWYEGDDVEITLGTVKRVRI